MLKNRLLKVLPVLMALLLVFTVSVFATVAEGEDESAGVVSEETTAEETSAEGAASDGAAEESSEAAESEGSAEASANSSSEASKEASSEGTSDEQSASNIPWKLIITVVVIIVIAVVLFILAKTNSKLGQRIAKFFKDYKSEIGKISWMSRKDLVRSTLVVLAVLVVAAVAIGLLDFGFSKLVGLLSSIG